MKKKTIKRSKWVKKTGSVKKKDSSSIDLKNVFDMASIFGIINPGQVNGQTGAMAVNDPENNPYTFIMYCNLHVPFILNPYVITSSVTQVGGYVQSVGYKLIVPDCFNVQAPNNQVTSWAKYIHKGYNFTMQNDRPAGNVRWNIQTGYILDFDPFIQLGNSFTNYQSTNIDKMISNKFYKQRLYSYSEASQVIPQFKRIFPYTGKLIPSSLFYQATGESYISEIHNLQYTQWAMIVIQMEDGAGQTQTALQNGVWYRAFLPTLEWRLNLSCTLGVRGNFYVAQNTTAFNGIQLYQPQQSIGISSFQKKMSKLQYLEYKKYVKKKMAESEKGSIDKKMTELNV